jgi:acetyl esterase
MDPLRDEGKAYADKLSKAGVKVKHVCFPGVPHPFMLYDAILDAAKQYNITVVDMLKEAFAVKK